MGHARQRSRKEWSRSSRFRWAWLCVMLCYSRRDHSATVATSDRRMSIAHEQEMRCDMLCIELLPEEPRTERQRKCNCNPSSNSHHYIVLNIHTYQLRERLTFWPKSIELCECQLVSQAQGQPRVLQHVVEVQVLHLVVGRVDLLVRVLEVALDHKS